VLVYDSLGRLKQGIDGLWELTRFEYDDADRLVSAQDATGNVRRYAYDPNGNLESEELFATADGTETLVDSVRHEYDLSDRRIETTANDGGVTSFEFDAAGNVVRTTDPDGHSTTIGYDELNRAVWAADQEGNRVSKQLDIDGRPLSVTDPNGFTVTYDYYDKTKDLRVKRVTQPQAAGFAGGRAVEYDYDARGQVTKTSVLPADGGAARISLATYNELGLPTRTVGPVVTDPALGKIRPVTRTTYNALGYVTKVDAGRTAAVGTDTTQDVVTVQATYVWDDFGRKLEQTDAAGKFWSYAYDTAGNLRRIVDPNGHVTEQTFQPGGRLATRETKSGGTTLFAAVSYERNALGQALSVTSSNPAYTQSFEYDAGHRLSRVEDSRGGKALHYEYSPGGRLDAMWDSDGGRTEYLYDPVGRLAGISAPSGDYFAFGYDRGGRLTERWAPNGVHSAYAYNEDGTLASIEHTVGGQERARHSYTYDAWGNRTEHAEALLGAEVKHLFIYDELHRLIQEQGTGGALKYRYDILGNRTRVTLPDNTYSTYVYDTLNQLLRIDDYSAANVKQRIAASFTYDPAGNLLTRTEGTALSQTLTWNPASQLASVSIRRTLAGATTDYLEHYAYDHEGRRIARSLGAQTTDWLYNGPDIYTEYRGDWSQATERHTHGPATDDPLLVENGLGKFYYHADGRGSLSLLTDEAAFGWVLRRYAAWGTSTEARDSGGAFTPRYGYTGREQDETSGLMYYRARYYDPAIGRFISRDPIGIAGGINLYAYAANNPTTLTDPMGTLPQLPTLAQNSYYSMMSDAPPVAAGATMTAAFQSSALLRSTVPGQVAWDRAVNSFLQGNYNSAVGYTAQVFAEQAMFVGTLGTGSLITTGTRTLTTATVAASERLSASGVWNLGPVLRGNAIENTLGRNLPQSFPTIDRFESGLATSIKSIDLNAKTYLTPSALERTVRGYIDKVSAFTGAARGGARIEAFEIQGRALELAIPQGSGSVIQRSLLDELIGYGQQQGVTMRILGVQ
jgi:RHS repeat-associated protein